MFAFYNRLNLHVGATEREVIRATRGRLTKKALGREGREGRHWLIRRMLAEHRDARELYQKVQGGGW
jgi:hypothetical protein